MVILYSVFCIPVSCISLSCILYSIYIFYHLFFIINPLSFFLYPFILYPLFFILLFFILYSLSFILYPLYFIFYPLSFILYPLSFILYPLSFIMYSVSYPIIGIFHPLSFILYAIFITNIIIIIIIILINYVSCILYLELSRFPCAFINSNIVYSDPSLSMIRTRSCRKMKKKVGLLDRTLLFVYSFIESKIQTVPVSMLKRGTRWNKKKNHNPSITQKDIVNFCISINAVLPTRPLVQDIPPPLLTLAVYREIDESLHPNRFFSPHEDLSYFVIIILSIKLNLYVSSKYLIWFDLISIRLII